MKDWRTRDWFWLVGILLGINILTITFRLNDNDSVVNIISLLASASSITLAIVAIWQSSTYNNQSNEVFNSLKENLSILGHNVDTIKQNIIKEAADVIDKSDIPDSEKDNLKANIENAIINPISVKLIRMKIIFKFDDSFIKGEKETIKSSILEKIHNLFGRLYDYEEFDNENDIITLQLRLKRGSAAAGNPEMVVDDIIKNTIGEKRDLIKYEIQISKFS